MPFHTAIYKMARLPADRIGLTDRGRIEAGAIADIAVLDADAVIDKATFDNPHQYAEGAVHVFVAGEAGTHSTLDRLIAWPERKDPSQPAQAFPGD